MRGTSALPRRDVPHTQDVSDRGPWGISTVDSSFLRSAHTGMIYSFFLSTHAPQMWLGLRRRCSGMGSRTGQLLLRPANFHVLAQLHPGPHQADMGWVEPRVPDGVAAVHPRGHSLGRHDLPGLVDV